MQTLARDERGSVLIIAVIAMLIMGVLSLSFALLANLETTIGFNYKQQAQAEALAEAGLEHARDLLRTAANEPCGFSRWTAHAPDTLPAGCGTVIGSPPLVLNGATLGPGQYWAVVDNDCGPNGAINVVPTSIQQASGTLLGTTYTCPTTIDTNETAVVTAWAEAGSGKARVRGILSVDSPWKHVCSDHKADSGGICNDDSNANGNPTVTPADPNDPNGPRAYDDLPRPFLGCSRIDPTLHKRASDSAATQTAQCAANPLMYSYPYPNHLAAGEPRFVVMGADPAVTTSYTAPNCNDPGGGATYFGYFDCALSTPCPAGLSICNSGAGIPACVKPGDSRINGTTYVATVGGVCPTVGGVQATGMVFVGDGDTNFDLPSIGSNATQYTIYVLDGRATVQSQTVFGTIVVEGDQSASGCPNDKDALVKTSGVVWTGPTTGGAGNQYGYPMAFVIYDPELADPTPSGTPQGTCADMGSAGGAGTQIHGLIYSGGEVEFNPVAVDGSIVAFSIQTQSTSAQYGYNATYGNASSPAPPGFPPGGGNQVVISRKSFVVCSSYAADTSGGTACP